MADFNNTNLNAHYTNNSKVARPVTTAVDAPATLPNNRVFNDASANKRMQTINDEIYIGTKKEQKESRNSFLKTLGIVTLAVLGLSACKSLFK